MVLTNSASRSRNHNRSIASTNLGGGPIKQGLPYQVGRNSWTSLFFRLRTYPPAPAPASTSTSINKKIWVLDNQFIDESAKEKTLILLKEGHSCFIWPKELKMFKDFNDICIKGRRDEITSPFILSNTYKGVEGIIKLNLSTSSSS